MDKTNKLLRISEIAKKVGVLPSKIRYYTDMGLLKVSAHTQGGHRLYDEEETIQKLKKIEFLSQQGYSIEEIKREILKTKGKLKILVIDDEPEVGQLVIDSLKGKLDSEIKVVYDGFSAGRTISNYMPDLILLDLMLPGVNGFEVCKEIRRTPHLEKTKILAITGYDSEENRKKIMEAGADDYLAKPMDVNILIEKISKLLNRSSPREP